MTTQEELIALRRLAELTAKARGETLPVNSQVSEQIANDPISTGAREAMQPTPNERAARSYLLAGRAGLSGVGAEPIANIAGFPQPENPTERIAQETASVMGGGGAIGAGAKALSRGASRTIKPYLDMLASNPRAMAYSSAGGGAAGGGAKEAGAGPLGKFFASLIGGGVAPGIRAGGNWLGNAAGDIGATIGASFGNQRAIRRIAGDAVDRIAGESKGKIIPSLYNATEYMPGVKPTVAEAITEGQMGRPEQFGGDTVKLQKDLSGASGAADILPSAVKQQRSAWASHLKDVKTAAKPMRDTALSEANAGGVEADKIIAGIDKTRNISGNKSDELLQKSLRAVQENIAAVTDEGGYVDANELYTIRKKLGTTIGKFSKETADWDKKNVARIERDVQQHIDDAIEAAGGTGWRDYLKFYSSGLKAGENQLARQRETKILAAGVKGSNVSSLAAGEVPHPPTLLNRKMMFINYLLKSIVGDATRPTSKYVAEQMRDPISYAKILQSQGAAESSTMSEHARRAALALILQQGL